MPAHHRSDRLSMPLSQPQPLCVLIHHEQIAIPIRAAEQHNRVVGEAIV
jgi:hypothetical protein